MDGLALQRRLAALGGSLAVVVMTGHADVPIAVEALKAGARDFLEKPFDEDRLLAVVREALAASQRAAGGQAANAGIAVRLASLTPREREVLDRLVAGRRTRRSPTISGTSPRTVEVQRARVMEKMGARSLAELVRMVLAMERAAENPPRLDLGQGASLARMAHHDMLGLSPEFPGRTAWSAACRTGAAGW